MGQPRPIAYLALGARTQVQDLQRFVRAIAQADEHGVSIARVLSTQAQEMRSSAASGPRRGHADPGQGDLPADPVHLPMLFIIVLGPAAIHIFETFSGP